MAVTQVASYEKESGVITAGASGNVTLDAPFTPAAGETILVWFTSGSPNCVPSGAPAVSGGITWTQRIANTVANASPIYLWTGTVPATPAAVNPSVPYSYSGTGSNGVHLVVQRFSGVTLPATPNVGFLTAPTVTTNSTNGATANFTQQTAGSGIAWLAADYNGVISGTPTYANADTPAQSYLFTTVLADWVAWRVSATAGTKTYGISAFSTAASRSIMLARIELPPSVATTALTFTLDMTQANAVAAGASDTPWNRETATSGGGDTTVAWPPVIQTAPAGMTGRAVKFTVPNAYKRYEMQPNVRDMVAGDTLYFGGAVYLDPGGISVNATNYQVVWQWRQEDTTGSPVAAIEITGGAIKLTGGYGMDTANPARLSYSQTLLTGAVTGHRYNIVALITNFATTEATSKIDVWIDGVQRLTSYTIPPATIVGGGTYWKQGVYHDPANPGGTIWHAAVKIGGSYAAVDPTPATSGTQAGAGTAVSGTRATAVGIRLATIPSSPQPGTDALQQRTLTEVRTWENWLATNNATGFVGEFGTVSVWARFGDQPQQDQWNALLGAYLAEADRAALHTAYWASGRNWVETYTIGAHTAQGTAGGPLAYRSPAVAEIAAHPSRNGKRHGVNLAGFDHAVSTVGGGNVRTDAGYAHTSADFAYLAADGIDFVRLPVVWEQLQPTLSAALDPAALTRLDGVLTAARANGVSVMVELHNYGRYTTAGTGTVRHNLVPNPALAVDATGWSSRVSSGGATASRVAVTGMDRPWAWQLSQPGAGDSSIISPSIAVTPGLVYSATAQYRYSLSPTAGIFQINYYDSAGTFISPGGGQVSTVGVTANAATRSVVTSTAPSGAVTAYASVNISSASSSPQTLQMTALRTEQVVDSALTYADGDTSGWYWDGTAGASTSSSAPANPGSVLVLGGGLTTAQFVDFWTRMATWIAADANRAATVVGIGLMNEPHDLPGGAATWQAASQAALTAIRNTVG